MLDLIFFTFFLGLFTAGFWCGKTYGTGKAMYQAAVKRVSGWFGETPP